MTLIKSFLGDSGQDITDEKVLIDEAVTINGSPYYRGFVNYIGNEAVYGNTNEDYGIWAATSMSGQRYDVLESGPGEAPVEPSLSTEITYDIESAILYATAPVTVYITYTAHGPISRFNASYSLNIPYLLATGSAKTMNKSKASEFRRIVFGELYVWGDLPDSSAVIQIANADAGGETHNFTVTSSERSPAALEFDPPLKITTAQHLIVKTADGKNLNGFNLFLHDF